MSSKAGASLGDLVTQALSLHKEGNLKGALAVYERVLPLLPDTDMAAKLSSNAGSILMQMGEYDRARIMFEAAVAGHPESAQAHFNLAVVLTSKLGIHDVAMKHCIKAMKLDPKMHKAFHLMGNILQNMGKDAQAEKYFMTAETLARQSEAGMATASEADRHALLASLPIMRSSLGHSVSLRDEGLDIEMRCISERPLLFFIRNFASVEECAAIRARAEPRLEHSYVVGAQVSDSSSSNSCSTSSGDEEVRARQRNNLYRDSKNAWLATDDTLLRIQQRIARLTGLPHSYVSVKAEEMQVVKYDIGGSTFKIHHDASTFQPRLFTALVYLSDQDQGATECLSTDGTEDAARCLESGSSGGETWFPFTGSRNRPFDSVAQSLDDVISLANKMTEREPTTDSDGSINKSMSDALGTELRVRPSLGNAILFFNMLPDGSLDPAAIHAGLPTCASKEKWIANYWIHYDPEYLSSVLTG